MRGPTAPLSFSDTSALIEEPDRRKRLSGTAPETSLVDLPRGRLAADPSPKLRASPPRPDVTRQHSKRNVRRDPLLDWGRCDRSPGGPPDCPQFAKKPVSGTG